MLLLALYLRLHFFECVSIYVVLLILFAISSVQYVVLTSKFLHHITAVPELALIVPWMSSNRTLTPAAPVLVRAIYLSSKFGKNCLVWIPMFRWSAIAFALFCLACSALFAMYLT